MIYRVRHSTEYAYTEPVPLCHNVVRLRPRDTERQRCLRHLLHITPEPAIWRERTDFFANHVTDFSLQEPHTRMAIVADSDVEVTERAAAPSPEIAWEEAAARLAGDTSGDTFAARPFSFDSSQAPRSEAAREYAAPSFPPGRDLVDAAGDLMHRIYADFKYAPGATTVGTTVAQVLQQREGVCQDFAHLMLAGLRSLGLAGRYVSGYLVTRPAPGQPRLVGCDASHAWASMYVPNFGWLDFDPTNAVRPSDQHITVAIARDYDDVAPVRGVILGGRQHDMRVSVDVQAID
jgi:transglutaminase-like putative cysteine protease